MVNKLTKRNRLKEMAISLQLMSGWLNVLELVHAIAAA